MIKIRRRSRRNRRGSRGSALLVSLMVIVGLSLLGLGFVAISETESAIAKNQQAALQTQAIAEAGARAVVEWFQDPIWAETNAAMPLNSNAAITTATIPTANAIKTNRVVGPYTGVYKPNGNTRLLDKPYRPDNSNRFFGDEEHADIIINRSTNPAAVDAFNDKLLASNGAAATALDKIGGEVTSIRVFAPPIVGGALINGFWVGGTRYGVATIKVTAQQFVRPPAAGAPLPTTGVLASHAVRLVVGELPLPIPAGPIQGNANVSFGGNFRVHWGMETSRGDLTPSLNLSSLPWANAYERPHFEHGYEPARNAGGGVASVTVTNGGSGYAAPPAVTFNTAGAAGTAVLTGGVVTSVTLTNRGSGYNPQTPPTVTFAAPGGAGVTATGIANVASEIWPIQPGSRFDDTDYFHEVLGKEFQDPFYGARAYQDNMMDGATGANQYMQCYAYSYQADEQSTSQPSYAFQWQDSNQYSAKKKVVFPTILFDYWKRIAQSGRGYRGIYYFRYSGPAGGGGANFTRFGTGAPQKMSFWVNTTTAGANLGPGVYFFDTKDGSNPQLPGADRTQLTDVEHWQSSDMGGSMLMSGFVYVNATEFGTTGQGSNAVTVQANFPGEPFRDVGYPKWNPAATDPSGLGTGNWDMSCGETSPGANDGQICRVGIGDSTFSCQDLNGNGRCDIVVMPAASWTSNDPGATAHAAPYTLPQCSSGCSGGRVTQVDKTWKSNPQAQADYGAPCTLPSAAYDGTNAAVTDCSEPHEPYLNLIYPDRGADNNGAPYTVVVGWEPQATQTYRPKQVDNAGNVIACNPPNFTNCTSNAYDVDGAVVPLDVILQGILYVEGQWGSEGNAWFFGSILVQDTINLSSGTADVWFDEKLLKGTWAPPGMPRVIVFSEQTDEQTQ